MAMDIAIVGTGISGLAAGWALDRAGHRVTLFEQDRVPGGHVATVAVDANGVLDREELREFTDRPADLEHQV